MASKVAVALPTVSGPAETWIGRSSEYKEEEWEEGAEEQQISVCKGTTLD